MARGMETEVIFQGGQLRNPDFQGNRISWVCSREEMRGTDQETSTPPLQNCEAIAKAWNPNVSVTEAIADLRSAAGESGKVEKEKKD